MPCLGRTRMLAVVFGVALVVTACGDDSSTAATTTQPPGTSVPTTTAADDAIEVVVAGGAVVGGSRVESVGAGDAVTLKVTTDGADHVHVHGYDLFADVAAGATVTIEFAAEIPGVFEVELEDSGLLLLELEVS